MNHLVLLCEIYFMQKNGIRIRFIESHIYDIIYIESSYSRSNNVFNHVLHQSENDMCQKNIIRGYVFSYVRHTWDSRNCDRLKFSAISDR